MNRDENRDSTDQNHLGKEKHKLSSQDRSDPTRLRQQSSRDGSPSPRSQSQPETSSPSQGFSRETYESTKGEDLKTSSSSAPVPLQRRPSFSSMSEKEESLIRVASVEAATRPTCSIVDPTDEVVNVNTTSEFLRASASTDETKEGRPRRRSLVENVVKGR